MKQPFRSRPGIATVLVFVLLGSCRSADGADARWADVGRVCLLWGRADTLSGRRRDSLPPLEASAALQDRYERQIPGGWGGESVRSGRRTIRLREPARGAEAIARLGLQPPVRVERARWTLPELREWEQYLAPRLGGARVVSLGVDEAGNRIVIGVPGEPERHAVEARLAGLAVPCRLVAIFREAPAVLAGSAG